MIDISIIIPAYNAQKTIKRALLSALETADQSKIEVIVVDDFSSDDTVTIVEDLISAYDNIKLIKLEKNSGSPAKPRNIGIKNSNGKYITFLDADDEINCSNLLNFINYANKHDLDVVKGYLKVTKGNNTFFTNKVDCDNDDHTDVMKNIIAKQSTTADIVIKRKFILDNELQYKQNYRVGEDTLFYSDLFASKPKIEYYNSFFYHNHKRLDTENRSLTQNYQDKELKSHINVWKLSEKKLKEVGLSYYELRLPTAVKNTLHNIIFYSNNSITNECFSRLSEFLNENIKYLEDKLNLHERYKLVYDSILENNYEEFQNLSKKRLLIAGYDLKFILPVLKYLEDDYNIKVDEWVDTYSHDEKKSLELLNWADYIFCEWLVRNAVWYSQRKLGHQRLIVRAHKFELTRDYGYQINYGKVDAIIAVSYYYLELFLNTFNIPREKMILLSNYVDTNIYSGKKTSNFKNNLAMVGYTPKWKGLLKGLNILKMLKDHDEKFKLYLMGRNYRDVEWIWNDPSEREYFEECEKFIKDNDLEDSVIVKGWIERSEMFYNIGYVLSVSDIESFHLAPAEGLCDGTLAFFLDWDGVEYVYPDKVIFNNINDMKDVIISTYYDKDMYNNLIEEMQSYVIEEFAVERFINELKNILQMII